MSNPADQRAGVAPDAPPHSSRTRFWLREAPYATILALAIFGIAYTSYSKQSIVGYWEFLAPVICLACIASGWAQAGDEKARLRLIWTQALHWLAFLAAMNLVLLASVQKVMNADSTGLATLMLLALGAFTAGVQHLRLANLSGRSGHGAGSSGDRLDGGIGAAAGPRHARAARRRRAGVLAAHRPNRSPGALGGSAPRGAPGGRPAGAIESPPYFRRMRAS